MRVSVTRSGGFAGARQQAVADTAALSPRQAASLRKLVDEAALDRLPPPVRTPDAFLYEIVIDGDRGGTKRYRADDGSLSDEVRALIEWVLKRR
jgi:hypothetical protein